MALRRATSLGVPEWFLLNRWGEAVADAFGAMPYLVGSVARAEEWRDVDVRLMLDDSTFANLTAGRPAQLAALNVAMSLWGQRATGLPIDFQFQQVEAANAEHDGPRNPIGVKK